MQAAAYWSGCCDYFPKYVPGSLGFLVLSLLNERSAYRQSLVPGSLCSCIFLLLGQEQRGWVLGSLLSVLG